MRGRDTLGVPPALDPRPESRLCSLQRLRALSSAGVVIARAVGVMVIVMGPPRLVFPAPSVAVAVMACSPSARAVIGVQVHYPAASTVAVQTMLPASVSLTVLPASPVPAKAGVPSPRARPPAGIVGQPQRDLLGEPAPALRSPLRSPWHLQRSVHLHSIATYEQLALR